MKRNEALRGADQRIGELLQAHAGQVTGEPLPAAPPAFALPPGEAGVRVCRAVSLTVPPGVDVIELFGAGWRAAGFRPNSWMSPDGPVLVGQDEAGFVLALHRHPAGGAGLFVISPALTSDGSGLFAGGIVLGAVIGLTGPCLSTVALMRSTENRLMALAFMPLLLLLGGGLLISPGTRRFGVGVLIGGAATGIATAGICLGMLS